MTEDAVNAWLATWVDENLNEPRHVDEKSAMHDPAQACVEDAKVVGITIAQLKQASAGDLERYLVERQNERTATTLR